MTELLNKNKVGLALGLFFAIVHLVWSLLVGITQTGMQSFVDWIFKLHSITMDAIIQPLDLVNVILLLIVTFIFGFIFGWLFALLHNYLHK